jgi:hypothetical protein
MKQETNGLRRKTGLVTLMVVVFISLSAAQSKCGSGENDVNGVVKYPGGINANLEFCLPYASKVPELQRSLNQVAKQVGGEKEQLREIKRLMTGLQAVGQNLGEQRQIELLKNFSAQIVSQQSAGQEQNQEKIEALADRLDDLKTLLIEKLGSAGTRDQTTNAINGPVGDAIATFDLAKAHDLLEDIRAQLNVIGGKVDESLKQEKDIKSDTATTRQILEQYQAQVAQNQKIYSDMSKARADDPHFFISINFVAVRMPSHASLPGVQSQASPWQIKALVGHQRASADSKLQIAFSDGQKSWLMNAAWDGNMTWEVNSDEIGERAVVCFTTPDSQTGAARQWTQTYAIRQSEQGFMTRANFVPDGDPTLSPATGAPCGGVTEVRESAHIESLQEQLAKRSAQFPNRGSSAAAFGRIDVSAQGNMQNSAWRIKVYTAPFRVSTTLYDVQVQMVMKGPGNKAWPVPLSNREVMGTSEMRYASLNQLGTNAVVCFTAHDSGSPPMRMTKWYTIEASSQPGPNGYTAAFVPSREPTLVPASDAPCE